MLDRARGECEIGLEGLESLESLGGLEGLEGVQDLMVCYDTARL